MTTEYEINDIFPNVKVTGKELEELIHWFESKEYYDIIMNLHNNFPEEGSRLQFVLFTKKKIRILALLCTKSIIKKMGSVLS